MIFLRVIPRVLNWARLGYRIEFLKGRQRYLEGWPRQGNPHARLSSPLLRWVWFCGWDDGMRLDAYWAGRRK